MTIIDNKVGASIEMKEALLEKTMNLEMLPPDPLLGLMAEFRRDARPAKIDLGVGVYRDDDGHTPVMKAVKAAEARLIESEDTKVYEGPGGNREFCSSVEDLLFGSQRRTFEDRLVSLASPGGCGAIYLALQLLHRSNPNATVWVSQPTWPNHIGMARSLGMQVETYPYAQKLSSSPDIEQILIELDRAQSGDVIIVQGPCHNPTGVDLDLDHWTALGDLLNRKGVIPLIDVAYHGFGDGLGEDLNGVQAMLNSVPTACLSYSCSKNFGLYRERTGCLISISASSKVSEIAESHLWDVARACYSMPPAHGAAIVQTILNSPDLRTTWETELDQMRDRIKSLRKGLAESLTNATGDPALQVIQHQRGMFSQLPISAEHAKNLKQNEAIYLPASGRINIAGMNSKQIEFVSTAIANSLIGTG